jgi:hypothetical protein
MENKHSMNIEYPRIQASASSEHAYASQTQLGLQKCNPRLDNFNHFFAR